MSRNLVVSLDRDRVLLASADYRDCERLIEQPSRADPWTTLPIYAQLRIVKFIVHALSAKK